MEDRAGREKTTETLKNEAIEHWQAKRKQKIHQIIMSKRLLAHQIDQTEQKGQMDQEEEEIKEEVEIKGKLDLFLHHKRAKRKRRKRCWNCKSAGHLRNHCPYIRCFLPKAGACESNQAYISNWQTTEGAGKATKKEREEEMAKKRKTKEKGRGARNTKEQSQAIDLHQQSRWVEITMEQYRNRHLYWARRA